MPLECKVGFLRGQTSRPTKVAVAEVKRVSFGLPHMEWRKKSQQFERRVPRQSPVLKVKVRLLTDAHRKRGIYCKDKAALNNIQAIADTGCQTTT